MIVKLIFRITLTSTLSLYFCLCPKLGSEKMEIFISFPNLHRFSCQPQIKQRYYTTVDNSWNCRKILLFLRNLMSIPEIRKLKVIKTYFLHKCDPVGFGDPPTNRWSLEDIHRWSHLPDCGRLREDRNRSSHLCKDFVLIWSDLLLKYWKKFRTSTL